MTAPKLRFKDFEDGWEKTSFQSLFIFKNGINASKEQYGSGTKFINVLDIINNPNGITYDSIIGSVQVSQKDIDKNLVNYGDVVFQRSSETREEVGQSNVYLSKEPVVFGGFVIRGSAQVPYDPLFMNGLLKTDKVRDQITQLSGGSTRFNIGQDSLNKVSVFLPLKAEQTKIATFLSAVDEKISQLSQKLHLLGQYKQGMMQKLFSQQIRFKADDGSEFGEWEERKLSDICLKIKDGTHFSPKTIEVGDYKYLTSKNVKNGYLDFSNLEFVNAEDHKKIYSSCDVKFGDVLLTKDGTIGQCCVNTLTEEFSLLSSVAFLRLKTQFNNYFLYHLLVSDFGQREINGVIAGQALKRITLTKINNFKFMFPCFEEQTKIANFLSAIDQKIDVVSEQLEQAKLWKKGLLQQMFV